MAANQTFYEILGVGRNAKNTDINRAYARLKAEMQKETSIPNPRLAAMAKVAYETLSDPARREEYDKTLGTVQRIARTGRRAGPLGIAATAAAVVVIAGAAYWFFLREPPAAPRPAEKALGPQELVEEVGPRVARLQGALMSGEVRELGMAVAVGEGQLATTCRGMAPGMLFTATLGGAASKAEVTRAAEDLDICILAVKGGPAGVKVRPGVPSPQEKIQAVIVNAQGKAEARQVSVARALDVPGGKAFELKAGAALPNGTPAFDAQGRLVGLVTAPHALGEGVVVALSAGRVLQARGAGAEAVATAPAPGAAPGAQPSTPAPAEPAPATIPERRGPRGTLLAEGFTTLWKEDNRGQMIEVMDNPKTGAVGDPIAYWTKWSGRDLDAQTHCVVTFGPDEEVVAEYEQSSITAADGYWQCALTRFNTDLMSLPVGDYTFTLFVDGQQAAEATARIERKFWTRDKYAIIVVLAGLGLLFLVNRRKDGAKPR